MHRSLIHLALLALFLLAVLAVTSADAQSQLGPCNKGDKIGRVAGPTGCSGPPLPECNDVAAVTCTVTCEGVGTEAPPPYNKPHVIKKCPSETPPPPAVLTETPPPPAVSTETPPPQKQAPTGDANSQ